MLKKLAILLYFFISFLILLLGISKSQSYYCFFCPYVREEFFPAPPAPYIHTYSPDEKIAKYVAITRHGFLGVFYALYDLSFKELVVLTFPFSYKNNCTKVFLEKVLNLTLQSCKIYTICNDSIIKVETNLKKCDLGRFYPNLNYPQ